MRSLHRFIERGGSVAVATHDPQVVLGASSVVEIVAGAVDNFYLRSGEYPLDYFSFLREVRGP